MVDFRRRKLGGLSYVLVRGDCMRINRDIVEEWLKRNDPDYGTNKRYLNNDRFRWVLRKEIPTDKLDKIDRRACA